MLGYRKTFQNLTNKIRFTIIHYCLLLSSSAVIAYGYFRGVDQPNLAARLQLHNQILGAAAPSPYRYRILVPFTCEFIKDVLSFFSFDIGKAFLFAYALYDFFSIFFLLVSLFVWLRIWFSSDQALIGSLFTASVIPIALRDHVFQPWSLLEVVFLQAAFICIFKRSYFLLAFIIILASLNRETALFIPLAYLLTNFQDKKSDRLKLILNFGAYFILWFAVFFGLRLLLGNAPHVETIEALMRRNTTTHNLLLALIHWSLFLGVFWILAILGFQYAPSFIKRLAGIIPLYLLVVLLWGVWYEVRLLMPMYSIFIPLGLSYVFRKSIRNST